MPKIHVAFDFGVCALVFASILPSWFDLFSEGVQGALPPPGNLFFGQQVNTAEQLGFHELPGID